MGDHYIYYVDEEIEYKEISERGCKFLLILLNVMLLAVTIPSLIALFYQLLGGK